jgi:hypothetical protein
MNMSFGQTVNGIQQQQVQPAVNNQHYAMQPPSNLSGITQQFQQPQQNHQSHNGVPLASQLRNNSITITTSASSTQSQQASPTVGGNLNKLTAMFNTGVLNTVRKMSADPRMCMSTLVSLSPPFTHI